MTSSETLYLDANATTPLSPRALQAMLAVADEAFANPSSMHGAGRKARRLLEDARDGLAAILGVDFAAGDRLYFSSGGTESNNHAIAALAGDQKRPVICPGFEHPSVLAAVERLRRDGTPTLQAPVGADGVIDLQGLRQLIAECNLPPQLVCCMWANNETGAIQPVAEVAALAAEAGAALHCDAVQAVGKIPVDFGASGAATLTIAAHKFHGPRGVGALCVRRGVALSPLLAGGPQEEGQRPGAEPVMLAVGMHAALAEWVEEAEARRRSCKALRDAFESRLMQALPDAVIHSASVPRLPNTTCVALPTPDAQALMMRLDADGVCCSLGAACASGSPEPSPTLLAMGVPRDLAIRTLRFSFTSDAPRDQAQAAAKRVVPAVRDLSAS